MVSKTIAHSFVQGMLVLGLAACTVDIAPQSSLPYPPLTERWPVTVALDYHTGFPDFVGVGEITGPNVFGTDFRVTAGPASADLVERVARSMFRDVVVLRDADAADPVPEDVALVIRPRIEKFMVQRSAYAQRLTVVYLFDTLRPDGTVLDAWRIEVWRPKRKDATGNSATALWQEALTKAVEDAVAQFATGWGERSAVAQWLAAEAPGLEAPTPDDRPPARSAKAVAPRIAVVDASPQNGMGECVMHRLTGTLDAWEVTDYAALRQAFYPWLFEKQALHTHNLERLREMPGYRQRLETSGFRYVVELSGGTSSSGDEWGGCGGGGMGAFGCAGVWNKDRISSLTASVWNLGGAGGEATLEAETKGQNTGILFGFIPLFYVSRTEGPACKQIAEQIVAHVTTGK